MSKIHQYSDEMNVYPMVRNPVDSVSRDSVGFHEPIVNN